jgi:hypothetical protein
VYEFDLLIDNPVRIIVYKYTKRTKVQLQYIWEISEKKLSPADFEILGIFCDHLSKELSGLFSTAEFWAAFNMDHII